MAWIWWRLRRTNATVESRPPLVPLIVFVVAYFVFIVGSHHMTGSSLDARLAAPLFVPIVVLVAAFLDDLVTRTFSAGRRTLPRVAAMGTVLVLAVLAIAITHTAWSDGRTRRGIALA